MLELSVSTATVEPEEVRAAMAAGGLAPYDAIVLAGGRGARLGHVDKPGLTVGGTTLLDRVLAAVADAERTIAVGPRRVTSRPVLWCRESPVGGGPVAAVAAGCAQATAESVLLVACDLPWIAGAVLPLRRALAPPYAVAALADGSGQINYLAAAWDRAALRAALAGLGDLSGVAMRRLLGDVAVITVPDLGGWGTDCDTPTELAAARARAKGPTQ
jgi:molybdopterin-guanine dinucleotide biosynthesis protein A